MAHAPDAWGQDHRRLVHLPSTHLPHGLVTFPSRLRPWIESWFLVYAVLGVVQGGMLPLLLPLSSGGSAGSLLMYPLVTGVSKQHGAWPVLRAGFAARTIAMAILAVAFLSAVESVPLALVGFVVLVMAWPLLGVSGTALAAQLAPGEKGEALGLFNAGSSLAGAVGAFLGGWAIEIVGFGVVCAVAACVVGLAVLSAGGGRQHSASDG